MAVKELEHAGDGLTHDLIRKINTTFVTPFDREDVYALASAVRWGIAGRIVWAWILTIPASALIAGVSSALLGWLR